MPCDTIQQVTVQFTGKNTNADLLSKALNEMGYVTRVTTESIIFRKGRINGVYDKFTGAVTFNNLQQEEADATVKLMKRYYSSQVVKSQAQKYGWKLKQVGEFEFETDKRTL